MKNILVIPAFFISVLFALVSCKKDYSNIVKLSNADTAKVIAVEKGEVIYITLEFGNNPLYRPGNWEFDTNVLSLASHQHINPPVGLIGGGGTDTWAFNTLTTGTTSFKLKNEGFRGSYITLFNNTIKVE